MRRAAIAVKKLAIVCHRWMGVAFCLLFTWWFISGIFMMYWTYPEVTEAQWLERAPALDPGQVKLSADQAYKALEIDDPPTSVRLASFDQRPAYFFRIGRSSAIVYADTGEPQDWFPDDLIQRTAAAWAGLPADSAEFELVTEPDQWTLQGNMRNLRPLHKFTFPDGQQVYVSENTGEVAQYTTTASRIFAHLGAIPHWLYYTPLRVNGLLWSRVVIWSSGIATVAALLGLIVGVWMYSPGKKYWIEDRATSIPYRGPKRLHTIFGLFFGILACTWAFSGMLSMDPFPVASGGGAGRGKGPVPGSNIAGALRGDREQTPGYAAKHPADALRQLGSGFGARQLEYIAFDAQPMYLATAANGETRIIAVDAPVGDEPLREFDHARMEEIARQAAGEPNIAAMQWMDQYDAYYLDRSGQRPLPVLQVRMNDEAGTRYYLDPKTATLVGRYAASRQSFVNRWLYHGLHSLDFPWLYNHRPAWDIVVLGLMLACTYLCYTSIQLSWQVLRRKFGVRRSA